MKKKSGKEKTKAKTKTTGAELLNEEAARSKVEEVIPPPTPEEDAMDEGLKEVVPTLKTEEETAKENYYESFLEEIFASQIKLNERIGHPLVGRSITEIEWLTKEFVLAMMAELGETLEWMNWKIWKKTRVQYDAKRVRELHIELVDLLHFLVNIMILWDMTPQMVVQYYREKNKVNHERQENGY